MENQKPNLVLIKRLRELDSNCDDIRIKTEILKEYAKNLSQRIN